MKMSVAALVVFLTLPTLSFAGGGGGIEYLANIGPDLLPFPSSSGSLLSLPSGAIVAASGFGYWISPRGWKIGGFGMFFYTNGLAMTVPGLEGPVNSAAGAFGGIISGGQARLGPFRPSLNLRLGAGGMSVGYVMQTTTGPWPVSAGTFAMLGSIDAELGLLFVPAMMISAYAGADGVLCLSYVGPIAAAAITAGIRITWGSF